MPRQTMDDMFQIKEEKREQMKKGASSIQITLVGDCGFRFGFTGHRLLLGRTGLTHLFPNVWFNNPIHFNFLILERERVDRNI